MSLIQLKAIRQTKTFFYVSKNSYYDAAAVLDTLPMLRL
jgi:hypothetical protein